MHFEIIDANEPFSIPSLTGCAPRVCLVVLPGTAPEGGVSPFDSRIEGERLSARLRSVVDWASTRLLPGGTLLFYGAPEWVALALMQCPAALEAHHLIAVRCRPRPAALLDRSHRLLAVVGGRDTCPVVSPVNVPHRLCTSCGRTLRDWGGRRNRMRLDGARLSDVWSDLEVTADEALPTPLLERIGRMLSLDGDRIVTVAANRLELAPLPARSQPSWDEAVGTPALLPFDRIVQGDCLETLRSLPAGSVDLAFADPPYNLEKQYASTTDSRRRDEYLGWCHAWLTEYARVVRPGGYVAVLTLPEWAMEHARFLLRHRAMRFQRWVAWDALAEPKGRGMLPAHYALLLFSRGAPGRPSAPLLTPENSANVCRRDDCVTSRPQPAFVPLTDIWGDIPRIRHARYRDAHPCQLPVALMERIVALASPPGGIVLDAFCGTGTTGLAARGLGRRSILADICAEYVELARRKLER